MFFIKKFKCKLFFLLFIEICDLGCLDTSILIDSFISIFAFLFSKKNNILWIYFYDFFCNLTTILKCIYFTTVLSNFSSQ